MTFAVIASAVLAAELVIAFGLSLLRRLGRVGSRMSDALCRAPLLDLVVAVVTVAPLVVGFAIASWSGLLAGFVGQVVAVPVWVAIHELTHRRAARGPRLVKAQNAVVGRWRNHVALWFSTLGVPVLWVIRIGQIVIYPPLCWLVRFPSYRHGDWVNVSRHKFQGLVGHDLLWCLYCDWMTGIYSLGGEMLRNIESFWCPIRFYDGKKCENCRIDFPDIAEWAQVDGSLDAAVKTFERHYADGQQGWFGHPARLTVHGDDV